MVFMIEDAKLIENYLKNEDKESLAILINRYLNEVYFYFFKRLNNDLEAEDLTQETFIKVWQNLQKFNPEKNFRSWLFTIAKNCLIDFFRKTRTKNGALKEINFSYFNNNDEAKNNYLNIIDPHLLAFEKISNKEYKKQLKTIINNLSPDKKELLSNYLEKDLTFKEISEKKQIPLNTIKSQYYRIIKEIKSLFKQ